MNHRKESKLVSKEPTLELHRYLRLFLFRILSKREKFFFLLTGKQKKKNINLTLMLSVKYTRELNYPRVCIIIMCPYQITAFSQHELFNFLISFSTTGPTWHNQSPSMETHVIRNSVSTHSCTRTSKVWTTRLEYPVWIQFIWFDGECPVPSEPSRRNGL